MARSNGPRIRVTPSDIPTTPSALSLPNDSAEVGDERPVITTKNGLDRREIRPSALSRQRGEVERRQAALKRHQQ